jgi:hypothetical protein
MPSKPTNLELVTWINERLAPDQPTIVFDPSVNLYCYSCGARAYLPDYLNCIATTIDVVDRVLKEDKEYIRHAAYVAELKQVIGDCPLVLESYLLANATAYQRCLALYNLYHEGSKSEVPAYSPEDYPSIPVARQIHRCLSETKELLRRFCDVDTLALMNLEEQIRILNKVIDGVE